MWNRHPLITFMNVCFFFLSIHYLQNSLLFFLICLLLVVMSQPRNNLPWILFLLLSAMNIFLGIFTPFIKIVLLLFYLIEVARSYSKLEMIQAYDSIFPYLNKKIVIPFLKVVYYKEIFIKNYRVFSDIDKELGYKKKKKYYFFVIRKCLIQSKKDLDRVILSYEKSLYFNKNRNRYHWHFERKDFIFFILHLLLYFIVVCLGRRPYAIFY